MRRSAWVVAVTTGLVLSTLVSGAAVADPAACGPFPTRHAVAAAVGLDGTPRWSTPLPVTQDGDGYGLPPVVDGAVSFLTVEGTVTAVDNADGRVVWQAKAGALIYQLWRYGSVLAVVSSGLGHGATVTGYDVATGAVDWRYVSGSNGLNAAVQTSHGDVAWVRGDGVLQVLDLTSGTLRWSTRVAKNWLQLQLHGSSVLVSGGVVLFAGRGALSAYDERTGKRRWVQSALPDQPLVVVADGVAVLTTNSFNGKPQRVVAMSMSTGKVLWQRRFATTYEVGLVATSDGVLLAGGAGPVFPQYLLVPRTGKTRWSAPAHLSPGGPAYVQTVVGQDVLQMTFGATLVDRDLGTGKVRWQVGLAGAAAQSYIVSASATQVYLTGPADGSTTAGAVRAYDRRDGHVLWTVTAPATLEVPPGVGSGQLVLAEVDAPDTCPA